MSPLNLLLFLRGWWKAGVGAAVAFPIAFGLGQCRGVEIGVKREKAAEQVRLDKARKAVVKREAQAEKTSAKIGKQLETERVRIEYRTRYLTQEVTRYVPQAADDRCSVNLGYVRLHNAGASGSETALSEPAGGSDQASGVALSDTLATVLGNYGIAHGWRAEAEAWRTWYGEQSAAWK